VLRLCQVLIRLRPRASALWLRVQRPVRWALIVLVIAMLAQALAATSWREVAQNLPVSPWFYLIFLINYFAMPLSEALIYRFLWNTGMGIVPALLRKRVYNEAVLDYSGEPVLFAWARQFTSKTDGELLSDSGRSNPYPGGQTGRWRYGDVAARGTVDRGRCAGDAGAGRNVSQMAAGADTAAMRGGGRIAHAAADQLCGAAGVAVACRGAGDRLGNLVDFHGLANGGFAFAAATGQGFVLCRAGDASGGAAGAGTGSD